MRLIPKKGHRCITERQVNKNHFLAIRAIKGVELRTADGKLNALAITIRPFSSSNKIPKSKGEDLEIEIIKAVKNVYGQPWNPKKNGLKPKKSEFNFTACNYCLVPIWALHNHKGNYEKIIKNQNTYFEFSVQVCHRPTVANYWHFELDIYDGDGIIIEQTKRAWEKMICSEIFSRIQQTA